MFGVLWRDFCTPPDHRNLRLIPPELIGFTPIDAFTPDLHVQSNGRNLQEKKNQKPMKSHILRKIQTFCVNFQENLHNRDRRCKDHVTGVIMLFKNYTLCTPPCGEIQELLNIVFLSFIEKYPLNSLK